MKTTIKAQLAHAYTLLSAHDCASPRLDAEVLLAFVLGKERSYLRAWDDKTLDAPSLTLFAQLIEQRCLGVPIAYLTEQREFWSRTFRVSPAVLIPRPETELLVELCLAHLLPECTYDVLDLGTGSGAIALTLALERPRVSMTAIDKSEAALEIAKENAARYPCQHPIRFMLSDWFSALPSGEKFDFILSNPPYIAQNDVHLSCGDVRFEPLSALVSAEDGLFDIHRIASEAKSYLQSGGQLWFEHGYNQGQAVQALLASLNYHTVQTYFDLAGQARVTKGIL
ncbi:MAG TPA: peptide chain release factor N(5)-glutamine methyltransferase [Methylococcaceae bacterium]|nr:peptide chain release factor N(5)-glutamine methyltransferase [Methylococcaceae bacterium]